MLNFKRENIVNEPIITDDKIILTSTEKTDFFNFFDADTGTIKKISTAPYIYTEVEGDFIATVKVSATFKDTYDSAVLMLMQDENTWAKACLELTDFGKIAVVSVVTNNLSDDANGNNLDTTSVNLKAVRVNNDFSFHYSTNGTDYEMMRFFHIDAEKCLKVGLVAQSPTGNGTECIFNDFEIKNVTAKNIRKGE